MLNIKLFSAYGRLLEETTVKNLEEAKALAIANQDCMGFTIVDENGKIENYSYDCDEETNEEIWKKEA